ncbi:pyridoxal phosphate-dependent transferase [Trichophaea hybrida]|nr:pyridoxal phosphate-dependent transferase [Trichophaea hybrida]
MSSASFRPKESPYAHIDAQHKAIGAYFFGPQAENYGYFKELIELIINDHRDARQAYHPDDGVFVTQGMQSSPPFWMGMANLRYGVEILSNILKQHSAPFWSPRYSAHMCMDTSMPASLAYFMTMLYNPKNVAIEASPITTELELRAGRQLCMVLGYRASEDITFPNFYKGLNMFDSAISHSPSQDSDSADDKKVPLVPESWGHITCDGTHLARNLKFYPLSLLDAMEKDSELTPILEKFEISNCKGEMKLFKDLSVWELLNLRVPTILEIPERLEREFSVPSSNLEKAIKPFSIQSTGQHYLERKHGINKPIQYIVSSTRHYSWPKGSNDIVNVPVDNDGRLNIEKLKTLLKSRVMDAEGNELPEMEAVFAVIATIGSTEKGAVDPLDKILDVRTDFQEKYGLSFVIHADPAWGGYFASMVYPSREELPFQGSILPPERSIRENLVPTLELKSETIWQLLRLRDADSITIDPYKSGYIPYPAENISESIGIYGVEGGKPGAAAAATFLSNKVIGIGQDGYGWLLGELFAQWSAMTENEKFRIEKIRKMILDKNNSDLLKNSEAMKLLGEIDVGQTNNLNKRIVERLSISLLKDDSADIDLFLTSTVFEKEHYGDCAEIFKERVGVKGAEDLFVLRNVVMSPFLTDGNFIKTLAEKSKEVAAEEVKISRQLCTITEKKHSFILCGFNTHYLIYEPMFWDASCRQQAILHVKLSDNVVKEYTHCGRIYPSSVIRLITKEKFFILRCTSEWNRYPQNSVPFYLFGKDDELHIERKLVRGPNIQMCASNIEHNFQPPIPEPELKTTLTLVIKGPYGIPFRPESDKEGNTFPFKFKQSFAVEVFRQKCPNPISKGRVTASGLDFFMAAPVYIERLSALLLHTFTQ